MTLGFTVKKGVVMAKLAVSGNQLNVKNPNQIQGLIELVAACALALIILANLPTAVSLVRQALSLILQGQRPEAYLLRLIFTGLLCLTLLFCTLNAVRKLFRGLRFIPHFFVPPGIPKDTNQNEIMRLMQERVISTFEKSSSELARIFHKKGTAVSPNTL
jgi:hypothetical protein